MKGLQFLGNRVEDAANAFIDVLKYSDQSVDYPDFKDIEPWPDEIVNMFKDALKDKPFSEIIISRAIPIHGVLVVVNAIYYPKRKW